MATKFRNVREKMAAYSGPSRPLIPEHSVHGFRSKASTDSGDVVLPFRRIPSTLGA
jgi:hypothetical protein